MKSKQRTNGFTIVELLIVIVVIGILAAVSIVAYQGITQRTNDTVVQSDLNSVAKKLQIYQTESGSYPWGANWSDFNPRMKNAGVTLTRSSYATVASDGNFLYMSDNGGENFGIVAKSKLGKVFCYTSRWSQTRECTSTGGSSGFPGSGSSPYRSLMGGMSDGYSSWAWGSNKWDTVWLN